MKKLILETILLIFACSLLITSCKKENPTDLTLEDDGLTEEAAQSALLEEGFASLHTGVLKNNIDTNNLPAMETYHVFYKKSFRKSLAEQLGGANVDRENAAIAYERDTKMLIKQNWPQNPAGGAFIPDTQIDSWFDALVVGFTADLNPEQVKFFIRDPNVDAVSTTITYEEKAGEPVFSDEFNRHLFVHGYKDVINNPKKIFIVDTYHSASETFLNLSFVGLQNFGVNGNHGQKVAFVAGAKVFGANNCRGISSGAPITFMSNNLTSASWLKAINRAYTTSEYGEPINISMGVKVMAPSNPQYASLLKIEEAILNFEGYEQSVIIAAGQEDDWASNYSPARLGLKFKNSPSKYEFLNVVSSCYVEGTETQIKSGNYVTGLLYPSNYGRAVRYCAIGIYKFPDGSTESGTSFSAPVVTGILYQNSASNFLRRPATHSVLVKYKKGGTNYSHTIPKHR